MSDWSSSQFLKFQNQRTLPAMDWIKRIELKCPQNALDIDCIQNWRFAAPAKV